jgi:hypothetical protein
MATGTVETIVNDALKSLGLPSVSYVTGGSNEYAIQCLALLNQRCKRIYREIDWQYHQKTATFTGDGVITQFDLPADWGRQVDQTAWDASNRAMLGGPVSPMEWGWLQYGITAAGTYYRYRILQDKFSVFPVPANATVFKLAYVKSDWAAAAGTGTRISKLTAGGDIPDFSEDVLVAGLKLDLWAAKGFDTTQLDEDYRRLLSMEKAQNTGGRVIDLSGMQGQFLIDPSSGIDEGNW